ncbi:MULTISPECIES: iron ABC transporter permease [unclassified Crossiella]|uniref:FecCD family ABC transporter permease n=1 Tax=unclassified Crossiella TaxID=2620835 RepID=UPI001FFE3012|nr:MULTISPECIES: iron ABC transporter permease [unclassified Crossiella]MCK2243316.1 iron ABC transporter permease [Crossiella sp. S99.2]MCK2254215.1 iron ABC transporter permease [Crossiella sp. S99.1]
MSQATLPGTEIPPTATPQPARVPVRAGWRVALLVGLGGVAVLLAVLAVSLGSVRIPVPDVVRAILGEPTETASWAFIVTEIRIPRALTGLLAGAALGVAGLKMQTLFRNPLADPHLLGVNAGASFGVSLVLLGGGSALTGGVALSTMEGLGTVTAAALGAAAVMAVMLLVAALIRSTVIVIVIGVMVNAFVLAMVDMLVYYAQPEAVKTFTDWSAGSFQSVTWQALPVLAGMVLAGLVLAVLSVKRLNLFLLGEGYAESLGVSVRAFRWTLMAGAALLAGAVTAHAGPIAFLGIAAPHLARGLLRTADHRYLIPGAAVLGATIAVAASILSQLPGSEAVLPLNTTLALLGAPVVTWVLVRLGRGGRGLEV